MKHFNCFVRYEDANKSYSIFIQIPENIINSYDPDSIRKRLIVKLPKDITATVILLKLLM